MQQTLEKMLALADVYHLGGDKTKELKLVGNQLTRVGTKANPTASRQHPDIQAHLRTKLDNVDAKANIADQAARKQVIQKAIDAFSGTHTPHVRSQTLTAESGTESTFRAGPAGPNYQTLTLVEKQITQFEQGDQGQQNKGKIFKQARDHYKSLNINSPVHGHRLAQQNKYQVNRCKDPQYFSEPVTSFHARPHVLQQGYYTYAPAADNTYAIHVDFANMHLGGGALGHGFVQEEVMFATMPNAAEHLINMGKNREKTREGFASGPFQGSPTPYLMTGVVRTAETTLYGRGIDAPFDPTRVKTCDNRDLNILAIAAPDLSGNRSKATSLEAVKDLFNTAHAGFALAKEKAEDKQCVVHTGKLGCGVFSNNVDVAVMTQMFAADLQGVDLFIYDIQPEEQARIQAAYDMLKTQFQGKTIAECLALIQQKVGGSP